MQLLRVVWHWSLCCPGFLGRFYLLGSSRLRLDLLGVAPRYRA